MTQVYKTAAAGVARQAVPCATTYAREMSAPKSVSAGHTVAQMSVFPRDLRPASRGRPLPGRVAQKMQSFFGQDLSTVRVHEDSHSGSIHARAFTRGENLHFAPGEYQPHTLSGQRLLGHELSHVLQQRAGRVAVPSGAGTPINSSAALESEAEQTGAKAARHTPKSPMQASRVTGRLAGGTRALRGLPDYGITTPVQMGGKKKSKTNKGNKPPKVESSIEVERRPFTYATIKAIPVKRGQHRRHIISSHVMLGAIKSFLRQPKMTGQGTARWKKLWQKYKSAQNLHNMLNNYQPNLIPGPGAANSAIGMITNRVARDLKNRAYDKGSPEEHQVLLNKRTGLQSDEQQRLMSGVSDVFINDEDLHKSAEERKKFAEDVVDSTDFDWPKKPNPELFVPWSKVYLRFREMNVNPERFTAMQFIQLINDFFSLPRPVAKKK